MTTPLAVKQVEDALVPAEVLAQAIVDISAGVKKLLAGRLNEDALALLIQNAAPRQPRGKAYPLSTIRAVLHGLGSLEATYVKKLKAVPR